MLKTAAGLLLILTVFVVGASAQQIPTPPPQPPGGSGDSGEPVLIAEGAGYGLTGAYTTATKLYRDPTDPEHATEPQTGRNFHWDSDTNMWVDSATGRKHKFLGYLCTTSGPSATASPSTPQSAQDSQTPQPPGGPEDSGEPVIVPEAGASSTGAFTTGIVLWRDPTDPQRATEPQTGRSFHFDPDTNMWVNSATGMEHKFWGYVCSTPSPSTTLAPGALQTSTAKPQPTAPPKEKQDRVSRSGFAPTIQLRGFGGASFINGNTPSTAGFDGAVLFPLGNRVLVGPTAGFQWVDSSIVKTIGGGPPPSTFIHTSVGFKSGNFGGRIAFPFGGWQLGIHGGATVAGSTITQATGFCGNGTPSGGPAGCTVTSSSTAHDTIVGPFVGGYISHSIFSHVGVFAEYDYLRLKDTASAGTIFDLHQNEIKFGLEFHLWSEHGTRYQPGSRTTTD